jgi:hypothetical protein
MKKPKLISPEQRARVYTAYEQMMALADEAEIVQDVQFEVMEVPDGGLSFRVLFRHNGVDCEHCFTHPGADGGRERSVEPDNADVPGATDCGK